MINTITVHDAIDLLADQPGSLTAVGAAYNPNTNAYDALLILQRPSMATNTLCTSVVRVRNTPLATLLAHMPDWCSEFDRAADYVGLTDADPDDGIIVYTPVADGLLSVSIAGPEGATTVLLAMSIREAESHGWIPDDAI